VAESVVGIIGMGHRLPAKVRKNDDPVFDWLHAHPQKGQNLFYGFDTRYVLDDRESVVDILEPAARAAMGDAGVGPAEIDHVIGRISPGQFILPDSLFDLVRRLKFPDTTLTIPLDNDFANFTVGVRLADTLVRSGRARNVLVAVGGGWSRAVSYTTPQAVSVGDGAAAAVVGLAHAGTAPRWTVIDDAVIAREANFGEMGLFADRVDDPKPPPNDGLPASDPTLQRFTGAYFQINADGLKNFSVFGGETAPLVALAVIGRQRIDPMQITLTGHQSSDALLELWRQKFAPTKFFDTLRSCGNMTVANIPVNLCMIDRAAATPFVLALSLAEDMHAHTLLLRRGR
jgi:3-oxoacyl-[acyl-carrier-protein] synthase III